MRSSKLFMPTLREVPADAEVKSHQLMIRAGFIRKLATGIFSYLPLGLRSLRKVETIVREEMERAGAQEVYLPMVQPAELWQESGRWDAYDKELLRFKDRHDHYYCLGPTHEEVITDIVRRDVRSYRDLPLNFFQIQTKFRDEIRPRFGLMRGREFRMKDAYSFDIDEAEAEKTYEAMFEAYNRIFARCGLSFSAVEADTGAIGGSHSHEFMVLADTGEDVIVNCPACGYSANIEKAELVSPDVPSASDDAPAFETAHTPDAKTVEDVTGFLKVKPENLIKTLIYQTGEDEAVAVLVRGDHEINEIKLRAVLGDPHAQLAEPGMIEDVTGADVGFAGPVGLEIRIIADFGVKTTGPAVVGANKTDHHLTGVVQGRDFIVTEYHDLRFARAGDTCPRCGDTMIMKRGIEVGHVFKLGTKYSEALQAKVLDQNGRDQFVFMGCYGIGTGRTMAAAIEQNHDDKGIIWPMPLAPFEIVVLPLQARDEAVMAASEKLYDDLKALGIDAAFDDRNERAGIKFNDSDLIGYPMRVALSQRTLEKGQVEFKMRTDEEAVFFNLDEALQKILAIRDGLLKY